MYWLESYFFCWVSYTTFSYNTVELGFGNVGIPNLRWVNHKYRKNLILYIYISLSAF